MKRLLSTLAIALLSATCALAQSVALETTDNFIEVWGVSQTTLTPDTFYVVITIDEGDQSSRLTAKQREGAMVEALGKAGIDTAEALTLNTIASIYQKRNTSSTSINYTLKLRGTQQLAASFEIFDSLNISNVYLERTESSLMATTKAEARTKAIENARSVAMELAQGIGQNIGRCIYINDITNDYQVDNYVVRPAMYGTRVASAAESTAPIEASEIKVGYKVKARFLLE